MGTNDIELRWRLNGLIHLTGQEQYPEHSDLVVNTNAVVVVAVVIAR